MSLFSQLVILVVSWLGILCGIALAYIAPEELEPGRKYFLSFKWLMWLALVIWSAYLFYQQNNYPFLILVVIAYLVLYILELTPFSKYIFIVEYIILTILYLWFSEQQLPLASLIFIYGLPTGTLLIINKPTSEPIKKTESNETQTG